MAKKNIISIKSDKGVRTYASLLLVDNKIAGRINIGGKQDCNKIIERTFCFVQGMQMFKKDSGLIVYVLCEDNDGNEYWEHCFNQGVGIHDPEPINLYKTEDFPPITIDWNEGYNIK